jgi:hypothetical protein
LCSLIRNDELNMGVRRGIDTLSDIRVVFVELNDDGIFLEEEGTTMETKLTNAEVTCPFGAIFNGLFYHSVILHIAG